MSSNNRKRLRDSSIKSFFQTSSKEDAACRAFNNHGISFSSDGILLDLTKRGPSIQKNPVGRPPKKLNQTVLPISQQPVALNEDQIREANEGILMGQEDRLLTEAPKSLSLIHISEPTRPY